MHGSAKLYVCCIEVPCEGFDQPAVLFSVVGCVGMMGFHPRGQMIGVNNINTTGARPGALWPAVVRKVLMQGSHESMVRELTTAPLTSGHTYLIASRSGGEFWEVMPDLAEKVSSLAVDRDGWLIHTNHCLSPQAREREIKSALSSTTHIRYELLYRKVPHVRKLEGVYDLLNDHENYPKSICSAFQATSQDPSVTCGGAAGDLVSGKIWMWRGDPVHDRNYVRREFGAADGAQTPKPQPVPQRR
jgi:isopenicillin-N N-acyltransferase-like protein